MESTFFSTTHICKIKKHTFGGTLLRLGKDDYAGNVNLNGNICTVSTHVEQISLAV